jgi:peroxiredoxin Q/BCP
VRELREFRVHHDECRDAGLEVAGISLDPLERNREWARRLELPYPLLSDVERRAGDAFGIIQRIGIGGWNVEFFRRVTVLADARGRIRRVWEKVKVRGHAREVIEGARAIPDLGATG